MKPSKKAAILVFLLAAGAAWPAWAETLELVTYYPTASTSGDLHVDSLTVGSGYRTNTPGNGGVFIQTRLAIGTTTPLYTLDVVGSGGANQSIYSRATDGSLARLGLQNTNRHWSISNYGTQFTPNGVFAIADETVPAVRLAITTAGFVGIGTTGPQGVLHVVGADDALSNVIFSTGLDTGAAGVPEIRVGIGTATPTGPLHVNRDLNGVVASGLSNPNAGNFATADFRVGQDITTLGAQQYGELRYWGSGTPANAFGFGNPNQVGLITATAATNGLTVATLANAPIKFLTNTAGVNNERMRITETGSVLIGTTVAPPAAPATRLAVRRDADELVAIRVENQSNTANAAARVFAVSQQAATPISIGMDAFPQNFNPALMGDFAPGSTAISTFATFGGMAANLGNLLIASRGPNQRIGFHTGSTLINAASERMRITEIGRVGIGIANPLFNLDVAAPAGQDGNIRIRGGGNVARLRLENTGPGGRNWSISSISNAFPPAGGFAIADETTSIQRLQIAASGRTTIIGGLTVAGGSKNFEIPHPLKSGFRLIHSTLEGPEIAVFYRGEGRLVNGKAVVKLPDYFEKLTRPEGRTAQLTAKGEEPFLLSYSSIENGEMKVHGANSDGEFSWEVKAIRADLEPLQVEEKQP